MSKQYQKKSASKKKRAKKGHGPQRGAYQSQASGVMGGMVQGFRRAVGAQRSKEKKGNNLLWTAATVALVALVGLIAGYYANAMFFPGTEPQQPIEFSHWDRLSKSQ